MVYYLPIVFFFFIQDNHHGRKKLGPAKKETSESDGVSDVQFERITGKAKLDNNRI